MAAVRRRVTLAGALALASLVLFDPHAPAAMAYTAPAPPVTVPGSVAAASAAEAGAAQTVGALSASGGTAVAGASTAAKAALTSTAASSTVVVGGWLVGTYAGVQIAKWVGLPTSGDISCDAALLLDPNAPCAATNQPTYVPNADVAGAVPGWTNGTQLEGVGLPTQWASWAFTIGSLTDPGFLSEAAGSFTLRLSGQCTTGGSPTFVWKVYAVKTFDGSLVQAGSGAEGAANCASNGYTWTKTFGGTSGYKFDHIEFRVYDPALGPGQTWDGAQDATAYYPVGHTDRPEVDADPVRTWRTTWECSEGPGGVLESAPFHESSPQWPGLPSASCAAGVVTHVLVEQITEGGPTTTITEWTAPQAFQDWATQRSECLDGSCLLVLSRIDPQTGTRLSCFDNPDLCLDWWSSPTKAEQFECTYGGSVVTLSECDLYRPTFNRAVGQPTTDNDGRPVPAAESAPYGDPTAEGNPLPDPAPTLEPTPEQDTSCPPPFTWTSLINPWWQFKAVGCALEWAFVPSADTVTAQVQATKSELMARPPLSLAAPVAGTLGGLADGWGTGCEGNVADFDPWGEGRLAFPCTPPQSPPLLVLYSITSLALVVSTGFYVWSLLVSAMNGRGGGEG